MVNLTFYEQGLEDGIERGQFIILIELLRRKLGHLSDGYLCKLESLESTKIFLMASNIFDINHYSDLDKYFV